MGVNSLKFNCLTIIVVGLVQFNSLAQEKVIIIKEDFNRTELGDKWWLNDTVRHTNGQSFIEGNQLVIKRSEKTDHPAVARINTKFKDAQIDLKFMLTDESGFTINFGDRDCKTVHAGHICRVSVSANKITIRDDKTGVMNLEVQKNMKTNQSVRDDVLKNTAKSYNRVLTLNIWHQLRINLEGDKISILINGVDVDYFSSLGFAHPVKNSLAFSVQKSVMIDDLTISKLD